MSQSTTYKRKSFSNKSKLDFLKYVKCPKQKHNISDDVKYMKDQKKIIVPYDTARKWMKLNIYDLHVKIAIFYIH